MHETHLVSDLMARVEAQLDLDQVRVSRVTLRVGALASTAPEALKTGIEERIALRWGYLPDVVVERSPDIDHPGARGVTLVSIQVEG